jgi:shikimate dehydrogenase
VSAPVKLAVLGDPLAFTLSPVLHRAGLESLGMQGGSEALRVPQSRLGAILARLAADGYRGVNLTHPLKRAVLEHLTETSDAARRAGSANTVSLSTSVSELRGRVWSCSAPGAPRAAWVWRCSRREPLA